MSTIHLQNTFEGPLRQNFVSVLRCFYVEFHLQSVFSKKHGSLGWSSSFLVGAFFFRVTVLLVSNAEFDSVTFSATFIAPDACSRHLMPSLVTIY